MKKEILVSLAIVLAFFGSMFAQAADVNHAPTVPSIPSGPTSGSSSIVYSYSTSATDSDGDQVKYTYDFGDEIATTPLYGQGYTIRKCHSWGVPSGETTTFKVRVMATDEHGLTSPWSDPLPVTITGPSGNRAPATPSIPSGSTSCAVGTSYSYSASATDPNNDQVKYSFDWGDGTPQSTTSLVNSGSSASASHTWTAAGTYLVKAMATDSKGAASGWSGTLTVTVTAANAAPAAPSIPSGSTSCVIGTSYSYSASATDPNNDQVKYSFDWGDGTPQSTTSMVNSGSSASASHTWIAAGTYLVKAMATDSKGAASGWSGTLTVTVTAANAAPATPSIPSGSTSCAVGTSYSYSASATDPNSDQVKYTFDWGDGTLQSTTSLVNSGSSASASHTWTAAGTYLVKAMATDSKGASSGWSGTLTVTVTAANAAPATPSIPSGSTACTAGTSYSYSASATDPNSDQVKYTFDWGDGTLQSTTNLVNSGSSASASHTWSAAGTYLVKAMATDSKGAASGWSGTLTVIVTAANAAPATPSIPSGSTACTAGTSYSYSASATDPNSDQVKYSFDWGDGTPQSTTNLVNSGSSASASHTWSVAGTYLVKAMATDSKGAASGWSGTLTVIVTAANAAPATPSIPSGSTACTAGTSYSYSASATDPNSDQVKYSFDWGDGTPQSTTSLVNSGSSASASHTWIAAGTYLVKAMATDSKGAASGWSSTLTVTVTASNAAPATPSIPSGSTACTAGTSYSYSASATDPNSDQVKYSFDWGDGTPQSTTSLVNSGSSASASHTWIAAGTYLVKAMATDSKGAASGWSGTLTVTVTGQSEMNHAPITPSIPSGPTTGSSSTVYSYSTSATDPDGDQVKYTFDFGDEMATTPLYGQGYTIRKCHSWGVPSGERTIFNVRVMATDEHGLTSAWSDSLAVTISGPGAITQSSKAIVSQAENETALLQDENETTKEKPNLAEDPAEDLPNNPETETESSFAGPSSESINLSEQPESKPGIIAADEGDPYDAILNIPLAFDDGTNVDVAVIESSPGIYSAFIVPGDEGLISASASDNTDSSLMLESNIGSTLLPAANQVPDQSNQTNDTEAVLAAIEEIDSSVASEDMPVVEVMNKSENSAPLESSSIPLSASAIDPVSDQETQNSEMEAVVTPIYLAEDINTDAEDSNASVAENS